MTAGETVVLAGVITLLGVVAFFLAQLRLSAAPACDAVPSPRAAVSPLRGLRTKVTIEDAGGGQLVLHDDDLVTSSLVQPGARTTWVDWKDLVLPAGEYELVLLAGTCVARATITVAE